MDAPVPVAVWPIVRQYSDEADDFLLFRKPWLLSDERRLALEPICGRAFAVLSSRGNGAAGPFTRADLSAADTP
jgi:hypothetical protein